MEPAGLSPAGGPMPPVPVIPCRCTGPCSGSINGPALLVYPVLPNSQKMCPVESECVQGGAFRSTSTEVARAEGCLGRTRLTGCIL